MLFRKSPPSLETLRKRIARLHRKGKIDKVIDLQRQLCNRDPLDGEQWLVLAQHATEGNRTDLALAARIQAATVMRAEAEEWLQLAASAVQLGFSAEAMDARFRAGDAFALRGDVEKAIDVFDRLLADDPSHGNARRLRQVLAARRAQQETKDDEDDDPPPAESITRTFIGGNLGVAERAVVHPAHDLSYYVDEQTNPGGWLFSANDSDGQTSLVDYVNTRQRWPTVIDTESLSFVGDCLSEELIALARPVSFAASSTIVAQGSAADLIYYVARGHVAMYRERGDFQDLGDVGPGLFFGEIGGLLGLPATATAIARADSDLRVIDIGQVRTQAVDVAGPPPIVSFLTACYIETFLRICPLFDDFRRARELWKELPRAIFKAGERLVEEGSEAPFLAIVTGIAQVRREVHGKNEMLGFVCPGDLAGELTPSPVTVEATTTVSALRLDRTLLGELSEEVQATVQARKAACAAVLGPSNRSAL